MTKGQKWPSIPSPRRLGDSLLKGGFVPFHDWFCSRLTSFLLVLLLPPSVTYFALCVPTRPARFSLREFYVQKKKRKIVTQRVRGDVF